MKPIYSTLRAMVCLLTLVSLPHGSWGQDRNVDWIHGLGGNASSFDNLSTTYFQQRRINTFTNGSYQTNAGVGTMANAVNSNTGGLNTIGVSHSMGGVAARQVDINNASHWSGGVTLGSPLRGARIVDAVQSGEAQTFINNGITQMLRGPAAGSTGVSIISPFVGILIQSAGILGTLFSNNIASAAVNEITNNLGLSPTTSADLSPGGGYMQGIVNQGTATPKIQIWGSESDPILWRLAGTFAADDDNQGASIASTASSVYTTIADIEFAASWVFLPLHSYLDWRGNEWAAGRNYINYDSNDGWAYLIGSAYSQTYAGYTSVMNCSDEYYYNYCDSSSDPEGCRNSCMTWIPYSYTLYYQNPSDGVVPATSQRNDGGAWRDYVLEAPGINHMEFLQQNRIDNTLSYVFNGFSGAHGIFTIPYR